MTKKKKTVRTVGSGNLYTFHGSWYLRFWVDGARLKQCLGRCSEFSSRDDVERESRRVLDGLPMPGDATGRGTTLSEFIERSYLPAQKYQRRASTYVEYEGMFRRHIKPLPEAQLRLWQYRTVHAQRLLDAIAARKTLSITTLKHLKAFLSGVFRHAARMGMLGYDVHNPNQNPVHSTMLPYRSLSPRETVAYTLDEIRAAMDQLEDDLQCRAIVAIAAFAGLRRAEIQGLRWKDYDGHTLNVVQTVWQSIVNPPKSKASASWVPVIPPLRAILDRYREECVKGDQFGLVTPDARMFRFTLTHVGRQKIGAAFKRAGLTFAGYHAFRRGLASNLFELGADDLTVQRILRHGSVQVTREHYIKLRSAKVDAAMEVFSNAVLSRIESGPRSGLDSAEHSRKLLQT